MDGRVDSVIFTLRSLLRRMDFVSEQGLKRSAARREIGREKDISTPKGSTVRCRANSAHTRQTGPGIEAKVPPKLRVILSSLGSGTVDTSGASRLSQLP